MNNARLVVAVMILFGAALAACSSNFGSGTTPPNGLLPSGNLAGISPTPTPTPNSASNVVTYGTSTAFQPLPNAAGYGGAISFPAVPAPIASGFAEIAIGATISVVKSSDIPDVNIVGKGKKAVKRERPARTLVYLTLLPTHDMLLSSYPRIAIDVPRDIVTVYRENEFGLALFNAGVKDTDFHLAAAELDTASPPPTPTPNPSAPPRPTPIPVSASAVPSGFAPPLPTVTPNTAPAASPTLPPQRIAFAGTIAQLKFVANRPVVFALYALPIATPAPSPRASGKPVASPSPAGSGVPGAAVTGAPPAAAGGSSMPAAAGSPVPVASGTPAPAATGT